jgi:hypothetical protein
MKNEMNKIPTPETNELRDLYENHEHRANVGDIWDLCECLENRFAVARVALDKLARLGNEPYFGNSDGNIIAHHALELTAPKP